MTWLEIWPVLFNLTHLFLMVVIVVSVTKGTVHIVYLGNTHNRIHAFIEAPLLFTLVSNTHFCPLKIWSILNITSYLLMLQIFDGQKCECWLAEVWMLDTMVNTCKFTPGFFQFSRQCFLLPQFLLFLAPLFSQRPSSNVIEIHLQYRNNAGVKNCYNHYLHLTYEIGDLHTSSELFTLFKDLPDLNKLWCLKFYYYLLIQHLK